MTDNLVTFVVINYNYSRYLCECINSILNQSPSAFDYEILVIDDGSTDDSLSLLQRYYSDKVSIYSRANSGIEVASNYGFNKANGRYICRVDSDDFLSPDFLKYHSNYVSKNIAFTYSNYYIVDETSRKIATKNIPQFDMQEIFARGDFLATGTLFNLNALTLKLEYKFTIKNSGLENYELMLSLLRSGMTGFCIDKFLFNYRIHPSSTSLTRKNEILKYGSQLLQKYGLAYSKNTNHPQYFSQ